MDVRALVVGVRAGPAAGCGVAVLPRATGCRGRGSTVPCPSPRPRGHWGAFAPRRSRTLPAGAHPLAIPVAVEEAGGAAAQGARRRRPGTTARSPWPTTCGRAGSAGAGGLDAGAGVHPPRDGHPRNRRNGPGPRPFDGLSPRRSTVLALDKFEWPLADGSIWHVPYQLMDDRSRFLLAAHWSSRKRPRARPGAGQARGSPSHQVPHRPPDRQRVGVQPPPAAARPAGRGKQPRSAWVGRCITGRPGHPQTQGKDERIHQTTLSSGSAPKQPPADTPQQRQTLIETFRRLLQPAPPAPDAVHAHPGAGDGRRAGRDIEPEPRRVPASDTAAAPQHRHGGTAQGRRQRARSRSASAAILLGCEHAHTTVTILHNHPNVEDLRPHRQPPAKP